jgi:hypothetical protein
MNRSFRPWPTSARKPPGASETVGRAPRRPGEGHGERCGERCGERGTASIWALLVTTTAFTGLLGLVVDGGAAVNARLDAARTAAQAARLGADQLSAGSVRTGGDAVDTAAATAAVRDFLNAAGRTGTVTVRNDRVSVTVTATSPTRVLGIVGIDSFPVRETQTAQGITGQDRP